MVRINAVTKKKIASSSKEEVTFVNDEKFREKGYFKTTLTKGKIRIEILTKYVRSQWICSVVLYTNSRRNDTLETMSVPFKSSSSLKEIKEIVLSYHYQKANEYYVQLRERKFDTK